MPKQSKQSAPSHLQQATQEWFDSVIAGYELEPHHTRLLTLAAESFDRCTQAREALAKHGITYADRFGQPRARPEVAIERDNRVAFARLIRELGLDVDPPADAFKPPTITGNANLKMSKG